MTRYRFWVDRRTGVAWMTWLEPTPGRSRGPGAVLCFRSDQFLPERDFRVRRDDLGSDLRLSTSTMIELLADALGTQNVLPLYLGLIEDEEIG